MVQKKLPFDFHTLHTVPLRQKQKILKAPTTPQNTKKGIFIICSLLCLLPNTTLTPLINPPLALFLGIAIANLIGNPFETQTSSVVKNLLKVSVIGLGFGIHAQKALEVGSKGFVVSFVSIVLVMVCGYFLWRKLKIDKNTGYLISCGTAICGGSAISAVSPLINAKDSQISVSLGVVFILNAVALFVFPAVGHMIGMTQEQFGIWAAIAIHDTSSVVGAGAAYGKEAAMIATTLKLARTLWIIPVSFFTLWAFRSKGIKIRPPYFILLFVVAIGINTAFPEFHTAYQWIDVGSKQMLVLTLFLIGSGLSFEKMKSVGKNALTLGISLWLLISVVSLVVVMCLTF